MTPTHRLSARTRAARAVLLFGLAFCITIVSATGATPATKRAVFDIPSIGAIDAFKRFAAQSGTQLLYGVDVVEGVKTNAIQGEFTPREAIDQMLAGTKLTAQQTNNGAIAVRQGTNDEPKNASRAAPLVSDRPETNPNVKPDETIVLSPFTVSTERDTGYAASSSLAGSRVRTELRDLAAPISVLTKDFLEDIAAVNLQEALAFAPGAETNFQSSNANSGNLDSDLRNPNANRLRGLAAGDTTRNFFKTNLRLDTYNSTRLELARGPNAILFGLGSPAGIINSGLQRAEFRHRATVETRIDSEGSHRLGFSVHRNLVDKKLAVFVAGLHEENETWQKPTRDHQNRGYLAVQAQPFRHTTVNANYENYWNYRQLGRTTLPRDFVRPWIAAGRPLQAARPPGPVANLHPALIQNGPAFQPVFVNGSLGAVPQFYNQAFEVRTKGDSEFISGNDAFAVSVPTHIIPPDINISGAASFAEIEGDIFNVSIEQRLGENLNVELAYNREKSDNTLLDLGSTGVIMLRADPNSLLSNGQPNPNVGRYYFQDTPRGQIGKNSSDALRLTGSYRLDLAKHRAWLGRHQFSALGALQEDDTLADTSREFISSNHAWLPAAAQNNLAVGGRQLQRRFYLDDPFEPRGGSVHAVVDQLKLTGEVPGPDGMGVVADPLRPGQIPNTRTGLRTDSIAGIWQGYLWRDRIVITFGWRQDRQKIYNIVGLSGPDGLFLPAAAMPLPDSPTLIASGKSSTRGIAFHATPWLSLYYNTGDNFSLSTGSLDLYSNPIPGAVGDGRDYGVGLRLFGDRLNLRATKFDVAQVGSLSPGFRAAVAPHFDLIEDAIAAYSGAARDPQLAPTAAWVLQDTDAKGIELEATINPIKGWRIAFNASQQKAILSNIALQARAYLEQRLPLWQPYFNQTLIGNVQTIQSRYESAIKPLVDLAVASDGVANIKTAEWRFNVVTNYDFPRESRLKGFSIGGSVRWVDAPVVGYRSKTVDGQNVPDVMRPIFGAESFNLDGSLRYTARFFPRFPVRLQLNVRNILDHDKLVPVRTRSDLSGSVYQAPIPRLFILSASTTF